MVRSILIITVSSLLFSLSMASDSYRSPQGIQVGSCPAPGKGNKVGTLISHNFRSGELSTRTGNPKKNGALDAAVQISKAFCPNGQVYSVGDVNGDNFIDHICIRKSDVVVLLGNLKQIAKSGQAKFCSGEQDALFVADMDGNGADDLVCHSEDSSLSIIFSTGKTNRPFLGQKVVTLKNTKICTGRTHGGDLALHLEDITGNKRAELVCQTQHKSLIEMWKSTGTGSTFKLQKMNPKGQKFCHDAELTFLDAEGKGRKEYLICKDFDDRGSFKAGAMWFFKFDPKTNVWKHIADWHHNTGFVSGKKYPSKNFCGLGHMKAADFNGDKRDDLVCVGEHQTKIILSPKPKNGVQAWFYFLSYGPNGAGSLTYDDKFGTGECEELFVH